MLIIPALYLQNGRCVSLYKGVDNDQKKIYRIDPVSAAFQFEKQGASLLHVTDLDRAIGKDSQQKCLASLLKKVTIPIEFAGGVRDLESIEKLFEGGVHRVVLGVSARSLIPEALKRYGPDRMVFGIKARRHFVDSDSLPPESDEVLEIAEQMIKQGITQIVYKDLEREGTLFHPNYDEIERLIYFMDRGIQIFSSGGVAGLRDLQILQGIGTHGVLIGRALMEGSLSLREAITSHF